MCRLLLVKSDKPFYPSEHLEKFAEICRTSKEYQGHGWGMAFLDVLGKPRIHKSINPIWEETPDGWPATTFLLVHARSAFRDEGIEIENNMPFFDERYVFIFNGELQGVRIKEEGRIGAEKIFNYIKRFDKGDLLQAVRKGASIIRKKTRYIRAMNIIMTDFKQSCFFSHYNEDPQYFAMHQKKQNDTYILCSQPYPGENNWQQIANNTIKEIEK